MGSRYNYRLAALLLYGHKRGYSGGSGEAEGNASRPNIPGSPGDYRRAGRVEYGEQIPYSKENGGDISKDDSNNTWIRRGES